ncbi:hypothetical protein [Natrinema soli]|uniref:Uncharacterized protein n=1 Tax=Natrinema soli TaxID=1930624 RepID=A0ABD5SV80_9EURY|nr:hypothetical protein [Natrinema soli]
MTFNIFDGSTVWNRSVMLGYILASSASVVGLALAVHSGVA